MIYPLDPAETLEKTVEIVEADQIPFIEMLVGGFNPSEKHESNWKSSPTRGKNIETTT